MNNFLEFIFQYTYPVSKYEKKNNKYKILIAIYTYICFYDV